ncbi:MAG: class II aldolase/adducin family protein [bacterium]|nr:class II aldolase/adducin family protein [bacterium]MBU1916507.1 class II aldolase/adducin family protein [bacterium]
MTKKQISKQIIEIAKRLYNRNMLAACDGNISYRLSDDEILITPSGRAKAFIDPKEISSISLKGATVAGNPSSERLMHLAIYNKCPKAKVIVHAHPPMAVAWSVAKPALTELPTKCLTELILCVGKIPIVPMAIPGTEDMGSLLNPYLPDNRVMILARHGAVSWGEDLDEAINGMERIEHAATILYHASHLGELSEISDADFEKLLALRADLGPRSI